VCIGPPPPGESYLNIPAIVAAAEITNADAIHPGYGFLSENANFARIVEEHGFTFIGPSPEHIDMMGDKISAKKAIADLGLRVIGGVEGAVSDENAPRLAEEIGYPVLIKAAAGGGGRGMKLVEGPDDLRAGLSATRQEAQAAFGSDVVYLEKYFTRARHIEVQVLADGRGNAVHLGVRDCSLQRRHQKVLEEAPSPALNDSERDTIGETVAKVVRDMGYKGVGTVEFLYEDGEFNFIEMNTRLQVEHPVSEMITGIDLVREQIRVAAGARLVLRQEDIVFEGHAIECRINAENPDTFTPSPGRIKSYHAPGGLGVRVESALYAGYVIPPYYDSMIAKLVVHGSSRTECLMRLRRALEEMVITGVKTTIPLHSRLIANPDFANGEYDIHWLEKFVGRRD